MRSRETLEQAGFVHGITSEDMGRLVDAINEYLEQKEANAKAQTAEEAAENKTE